MFQILALKLKTQVKISILSTIATESACLKLVKIYSVCQQWPIEGGRSKQIPLPRKSGSVDTAPTVEIEKPIFEEKEPNIKCEKKGKGKGRIHENSRKFMTFGPDRCVPWWSSRIDSKKEVSNNFYCILIVLDNSSLNLTKQRKR